MFLFPNFWVLLLEGLMLKFQYFGYLMQRANSLEKTLILGKIVGRNRRGGQRRKWLDGITDSMDLSLNQFQKTLGDSEGEEAWSPAVHEVAKSQTQLSYWTTTTLELHQPRRPCGSAGKESACNAGDLGSTPGLGRSSGEGKGYPFQYRILENSMECIVHGVTKSWTRLSDFHFNTNKSWTLSYFTYLFYIKKGKPNN